MSYYPAHPHTLFKKIWNTAKNDKSSIRPRLVLAGDALECSDIFKKDCVCYGSCGGQTIIFFFKDFQEHGDEPETCRGAWVTRIVVRFTNVIFELLVKLAMREGVWVQEDQNQDHPKFSKVQKWSNWFHVISHEDSLIFLDIPARLSICALQRWVCSLSGASSSGSTSKEMRSNQASTLGPGDAIKKAPMRLDSQKIGSMVIHHHPESLLCLLCHDLQILSDSKVRRTGHFGQTGCLDRPRLSARTRKEAAAAATWHLGKERCNDNKRYIKKL